MLFCRLSNKRSAQNKNKKFSWNQKNKKNTERKRCNSTYQRHFLPPQFLKACRRVSVCLPFKEKKGSMTVEAALVLPLFLFAFLNLVSLMELYRLQSNLSQAMYTTVKEMAVYGHAYSQLTKDDCNHLESYGLTYLYGAGRVKSCLSDNYLEHAPIAGGFTGISWLHSTMMENQCIDFVATYQATPMFGSMGFAKIPLYNRLRTRAWTGYDIPLIQEQQQNTKLVYMTPQGDVYHETKSCPYLRLSIRAVAKEEVGNLRNQDGSIYYPCGQCAGKENNTVFITLYGNKYHTSLTCGGLKRTIEAVPLANVGERHACTKCSK